MENRPDPITSGKCRDAIYPGCTVDIILKADQRSGKLTRGIVQEILTNSSFHPHGIKVRLRDGCVGRVAGIIGQDSLGTPKR
ncbi:YwbE family protein [Methanoregula sp.]|jgi:uncharacterized repeat protein (TIGR03833 family)|uniref:YwbE family protein n=1 Tax=Methanoregula sp. TaxID=2052170 RepID=UPI0025FF81D5|nr:YwbE family protein [Methanoregula sp.]